MLTSGPELRILPADKVLPHEVADPSRERKIEERLRDEQVLRDPVIVGDVGTSDYVLLDGTNRKSALQRLGYPWLLAQIVDYRDAKSVELKTWCHEVGLPIGEVLRAIEAVPDLLVEPVDRGSAAELLRTEPVALLTSKGRAYGVKGRTPVKDRPAELRQLIGTYEGRMKRIECSGLDNLASSVTVTFPSFSSRAVAHIAREGNLIPAGVTRHVILAGRGLRINLPLETLSADLSLEEANRALPRHLEALTPRVYREPTILFDS